MNIQCPNCETIFDLPKKKNINNKFKCSVCNHIWIEKKDKPSNINSSEKPNFKTIFILKLVSPDTNVSSVRAKYLSLSHASAALDISSRRKTSRSLYSE